MWRTSIFTVLGVLISGGFLRADPPATKGEVSIIVTGELQQPSGWPVVAEMTIKNTGKEPISWWSGGPARYPGAEYFNVEIRTDPTEGWRKITASNGENTEGSGIYLPLQPGESIAVPLASPTTGPDGTPLRVPNMVEIRIMPRDWHAGSAGELAIGVFDFPALVGLRRARVISGAIDGKLPFWIHMAQRYADAPVIEALLKMVTVDDPVVVDHAARALITQPTLPEAYGPQFAQAMKRWVFQSKNSNWQLSRSTLISVILKTQSEPARQAVLELLQNSTIDERLDLINELRLSPGDDVWLHRVREIILNIGQPSPDDPAVKNAIEWLDSRLKYK